MLTPQKMIWVKAPFSSERGVFTEYAKEMIPDVRLTPSERVMATRANLKLLEHAYALANPASLPESIWRRLDNTDSWWTMTPDEVMRSIQDRKYKNGPRDVSVVIDEFNSGKVRCPIIVKPEGRTDSYRLLAGNVRLMTARVSGLIPKCVFLDMSR